MSGKCENCGNCGKCQRQEEMTRQWVENNLDDMMSYKGYETAPLDEIPERRAHGLKIDWDTADAITKANLLDALDCARKEVTNYINSKLTSSFHEKDFQYNTEVLIPSLKNVLRYYGVDL